MATLYVSDLDGTLLQPDATLSRFARSGLEELLADGALFTVASARSVVSMNAILGALPGWVIAASVGAIAPAYAGMYAGSRLRRVISPILFRNIILTILGLIACKHIAGSLGLV